MSRFEGIAAAFRNGRSTGGKRAVISRNPIQARNARDIPETGRTHARKPAAGGRASCPLTAEVLPK
jgi:hypothetical protein